MGCEAALCKTSTPEDIFIVIPSLEGWPTKTKEAPSPHEVRLAPLDTNPVFQNLGGDFEQQLLHDRFSVPCKWKSSLILREN